MKLNSHKNCLKKFLDIPGEEIVLLTRTHWIYPAISISYVFSFAIAGFVAFMVFFLSQLNSPPLFFTASLVVTLLSLTLASKILTDWFFHMFLFTNHKILEITYSPFFSYQTNSVLLDQVRCTEVDEKKKGIVKEMLDIGNVTITFDRPTHQEEFTFYDIAHPSNVASQMRNFFAKEDKSPIEPVWTYTRHNSIARRGVAYL